MDQATNCPYAVVKFPEEENSLSVVPRNWISRSSSGITCKWPPENTSLKKAAKKLLNPTKDWASYNAEIVHYSRTYKSANEYLDKSRYCSEVEMFSSTDSDMPSKKRRLSAMEVLEEQQVAPNEGPSKSDFNRLEAKLDLLIKNTNEIKLELAEHRERMQRVNNEQFQDVPVENFKLMESLEQLKDFDEQLQQQDEFSKAVKRYVYIGGRDYKDVIRRILQSMFSHELALNLTWNAANGKNSLQKFPNFLLFINVVVRHNKEFKDIRQDLIEEVLKRWFRYASDRNGGRLKRLKQNKEKNDKPEDREG